MARVTRGSIATAGEGDASATTREVLFLLKTSVTVQPDENIMPPTGAIRDNLGRDLTGYLRDIVKAATEQAREGATEQAVVAGLARGAAAARNIHIGGNN